MGQPGSPSQEKLIRVRGKMTDWLYHRALAAQTGEPPWGGKDFANLQDAHQLYRGLGRELPGDPSWRKDFTKAYYAVPARPATSATTQAAAPATETQSPLRSPPLLGRVLSHPATLTGVAGAAAAAGGYGLYRWLKSRQKDQGKPVSQLGGLAHV
jgi:hypothetical protein